MKGRGISTYAIALRGFGETPEQPRGHIDSLNIYYRDIVKLTDIIKQENPGKKIFIVGESMGGLIAYMVALKFGDLYQGMIIMSPAFKNAMKFPLSVLLLIVPYLIFNPRRMIDLPYTSAMCSSDKDFCAAMDKDPRELRVASARILINIMLEGMRASSSAGKIKLPSLFIIPGKDRVIDERESRKVFKRLRIKDKELIEYPELLHAPYIEKDREKVFADILNWLERHI